MRLYNNTTNKPENIKFISNETGTYYVDKLTDAELIAFGYFQIVNETITMDYENFNYEETYNVVGDVCVQSYVSTPREIEIPQTLTPKQLRLGLLAGGMYEQAQTLTSSNVEYDIYFNYSLEFERNHPILVSMAKDNFNMTDADIDNFFIMAGKL